MCVTAVMGQCHFQNNFIVLGLIYQATQFLVSEVGFPVDFEVLVWIGIVSI